MITTYALSLVSLLATASTQGVVEYKKVSFVGFSRNEALSAWRVQIERKDVRQRIVDRYALIKLIRCADSQELTQMRMGKIRRYNLRGHLLHVPLERLAFDNPRWEQAELESEWTRLRLRERFRFRTLQLGKGVVYLSADADGAWPKRSGRAAKQAGAPGGLAASDFLKARGRRNRPLGYSVMARLTDGSQLSLGHFRHEGRGGSRLHARMQVYVSESSTTVAVLNGFATSSPAEDAEAILSQAVMHPGKDDAEYFAGMPAATSWRGQITQLPRGVLIATPSAKRMASAFAQLELTSEVFADPNVPEAEAYAAFVGRYWSDNVSPRWAPDYLGPKEAHARTEGQAAGR